MSCNCRCWDKTLNATTISEQQADAAETSVFGNDPPKARILIVDDDRHTALALSAAMSATVWERRRLLAAYKLERVGRRQIGGMLLLEGASVLAVGCLAGVAAGIFGHLLGSRWLEQTTGFSAPFAVEGGQVAGLVVTMVALALVVVAVPGYMAARVAPRLRFQE